MKQINLVKKGFCQSCKRKLDYDVVDQDCYFRFCNRCKASEYLKKEHFTAEGDLILNRKPWKLRSTEDWSIATNGIEKITLNIGLEHIHRTR